MTLRAESDRLDDSASSGGDGPPIPGDKART